jgi:Tol biopolymer transport system component
MPLTPGTRLGPYEIVAPLGAGGMGEIYRARDTKLAREVAIKVLPAEVSTDRDWLARFEREARSASALNHPNIVTIYEIGSADSVSYISMELVQGRTLRELLAEGPLSPKRLLALSTQIAEGLAPAHEAGIVHRDLKPENLMVTREGLVKILDFGLAKRVAVSGSQSSSLATMGELTQPGVLVGTVGYASPEQVTGRPVDFRSDQFSLGSIVYEMATGTRAFSRASAVETLAAIINEEPEPLQRRAPETPTVLRWAIERCLAKEPDGRYASTRDLARDLAQLRDYASEIAREASPARSSRRPGWLVLAAAASLILVAALALLVGSLRRKEPAASPVRFGVSIPGEAVGSRVTVSPDGTRLAIEAFSQGQRRIYLRRLDSDATVELPGSVGAAGHFWSPDSRHLAFYADGMLKKTPIDGGPPVELCEAVVLAPGAWSRDGTILFPRRANPRGLFRVSDAGGEPVRVTTCAPEEENHKGAWFLPDGRRFLYHVNSNPGAANARELRLGSLASKESRTVARMDSRAEYSPPGYLVYAREGALFAQRFDERQARLMGEPLLLADDVNYFLNTADAAFSVSQTGVLVYRAGASPSRIAWFTRDGKEVGQLGQPMLASRLRISPDGTRVAMTINDKRTGTGDIWLLELGRGVSTRLHSDPVHEFMPVWTADGSSLIYGSDRKGPPDIYEIATGATPGSESLLLEQDGFQQPEDISRDGRFLAYTNAERWPNSDIWLLPLHGERRPSPWARTRFTESSPRFSPDGRWIAYQSDESGVPEIYVALTQGGGGKKRISPAGGQYPRWRADGKELYYIGPGDFIMTAPVTPGAQLEAGTPVPLFRVEGVTNFDVVADGSRFLVSTPSDGNRESQVRVIVNWPATLKRD